MTEAGWGTDLEQPAPKRRLVPVWVWACGGGCALLVVVAGLATWFMAPQVKQWFETISDPEVQWAELAKVLPYEEPRPEYELKRLPMPILEMWSLRDTREGHLGFVISEARMPKEAVREWFEHPEQSPALKQTVRDLDGEKGSITIQGRKLECTRFVRRNGEARAIVLHIALELTPPTATNRVQFTLSSGRDDRELTDDDVIDFLAPFHVGTDR